MENRVDLLPQIEKLRRDLLWTRYVATALIILFAASSVASWTKHPKTIEANEFLLRNPAGKIVARLGQFDFGDTCLTLTAQQNVSVANLCVQDSEGSRLDLHNLKSDSRAMLTPGFNTYEPTFHIQPALVINHRAEDPKIVLHGPNGQTLVGKSSTTSSDMPLK